jgi:CRISPR-associated protein Csx10
MNALTYLIELQEPLLATALQGDPNSSVTLPYIPGSMLRGMLIGHYLRQHSGIEDPVQDAACQRLFFNGSTRYLHAYLYDPQMKTRCLPTPRSLRRYKSDQVSQTGIEVFDASNGEWDIIEQREKEKDNSLKPIDTPFCRFSQDGTSMTFYSAEKSLTIHTQRDSNKGRAHKQEGEIFRYEALAAGQWFQGVILFDTQEDRGELQRILEQIHTCWLGRSRSAGYGRVTISEVKPHDTWRETGGSSSALAEHGYCTMTLLSDTLLFDNNGQPVTAVDNTLLATILGIGVKLDTVHTFTSTVLHGGFNRAWQLPLPQSYMLAAGSVIAFQPDESLDAAQVSKLETDGIGARRAEGFGRVVFNWRDKIKMTSRDKGTLEKSASADGQLNAIEKQMAQGMTQRLLAADVEQALLNYVKDTTLVSAPKLTQLNRLRVLARQHSARGSDGLQEVLTQFKDFKQAARQQFQRARLKRGGTSEPLDTWITNLLDNPQPIIRRFLNVQPRRVAEEEARLEDSPDDMIASIALRLLAAVMEQAVRTLQKEERSGQHE